MVWTEAHSADDERLAAEIANEPQWVVFEDRAAEDAWTAEQLDVSRVASWWATVHV
jgi:hypothetical protein